MKRSLSFVLGVAVAGLLLVRPMTNDVAVTSPRPSNDQARRLRSLEKLSEHPLYVMHYCASYRDAGCSAISHEDGLETVGLLEVMRWVLDWAATVEEAIGPLEFVNVDMSGGPRIHCLVTDAAGDSALIEYWDNGMHVLRFNEDWKCATGYRLCRVGEPDQPGICWRYDALHSEPIRAKGLLDATAAMMLLGKVDCEASGDPEARTQRSTVYDTRSRRVELPMGHHYDGIFRFDVPAVEAAEDRG